MNIKQETVDAIYDVPLGNSSWEGVVELLKQEFDAQIGLMMILRPNQPPIIVSSLSKDDNLLKNYGEYYYSIDPWFELITSDKLAPNTFYPDYVVYDKNENFYNQEYYNDFWRPQGHYYSCGGLITTQNNISINFGFPREKSAGVYEVHESMLMTFYGRQVAKAVELEGVFGDSLPTQIYHDSLAASFGLSSAESRLVLELFKCGSLPEVSKKLNRSYHTVRNHMKAIFKKTETTNQIELFILLSKTD